MVLIIGNHWEYYFIAGILFSILAMIFYTQAFRLLEMDSNANSYKADGSKTNSYGFPTIKNEH